MLKILSRKESANRKEKQKRKAERLLKKYSKYFTTIRLVSYQCSNVWFEIHKLNKRLNVIKERQIYYANKIINAKKEKDFKTLLMNARYLGQFDYQKEQITILIRPLESEYDVLSEEVDDTEYEIRQLRKQLRVLKYTINDNNELIEIKGKKAKPELIEHERKIRDRRAKLKAKKVKKRLQNQGKVLVKLKKPIGKGFSDKRKKS